MFLIYTVDSQNPRLPTERTVHCVDTELADRVFVKETIQSDRAVKKLVDSLDDFIGDHTRDLHKPILLVGVEGDQFGDRIMLGLISQIPKYVTVKHATVTKGLFR